MFLYLTIKKIFILTLYWFIKLLSLPFKWVAGILDIIELGTEEKLDKLTEEIFRFKIKNKIKNLRRYLDSNLEFIHETSGMYRVYKIKDEEQLMIMGFLFENCLKKGNTVHAPENTQLMIDRTNTPVALLTVIRGVQGELMLADEYGKKNSHVSKKAKKQLEEYYSHYKVTILTSYLQYLCENFVNSIQDANEN